MSQINANIIDSAGQKGPSRVDDADRPGWLSMRWMRWRGAGEYWRENLAGCRVTRYPSRCSQDAILITTTSPYALSGHLLSFPLSRHFKVSSEHINGSSLGCCSARQGVSHARLLQPPGFLCTRQRLFPCLLQPRLQKYRRSRLSDTRPFAVTAFAMARPVPPSPS